MFCYKGSFSEINFFLQKRSSHVTKECKASFFLYTYLFQLPIYLNNFFFSIMYDLSFGPYINHSLGRA